MFTLIAGDTAYTSKIIGSYESVDDAIKRANDGRRSCQWNLLSSYPYNWWKVVDEKGNEVAAEGFPYDYQFKHV